MARPSIWCEDRECASRRARRCGRRGRARRRRPAARASSIERICTGLVCVRSTRWRLDRVDEEGVLHRARRVVVVEVQRVEVEPLVLELRALGDLPAHADEDVGDALLQQGSGCRAPARRRLGGGGDVDRLLGEVRAASSASRTSASRAANAWLTRPRRRPRACRRGLLALVQAADLAVGQRERGSPLTGRPWRPRSTGTPRPLPSRCLWIRPATARWSRCVPPTAPSSPRPAANERAEHRAAGQVRPGVHVQGGHRAGHAPFR